MNFKKLSKILILIVFILALNAISFYSGILFERRNIISYKVGNKTISFNKNRVSYGLFIAESLLLLQKLDTQAMDSLRGSLNFYLDRAIVSAYERKKVFINSKSEEYKIINTLLIGAAKYRKKHPRKIDKKSTGPGKMNNQFTINTQKKSDQILSLTAREEHLW